MYQGVPGPATVRESEASPGNVHAMVGKVSFEGSMLVDNIRAFVSELLRVKPAAAKGTYLRTIGLSSTMGPGVRVDVKTLTDAIRKGA